MNKLTIAAAICAALCVLPAQARKKPEPSPAKPAPYASTYQAIASAPVLIQNATVLTGTGERLDNADVLMQDGKIQAVGKALSAPGNAKIINGAGKWVTPGIIDVHSHLGVYASPGIQPPATATKPPMPVTANVWAEHSVWPQDAGFAKALAGGVTSMQILPGSANLVGGRSVILKNVAATTYQAMKFPGAPYGIKMACGENPKRVYGEKGGPSTRMGNMAGYRAAFIDAEAYRKKWDAYEKGGRNGDAPDQDLANDTLAGVLRGDITVNIHCYRADEMAADDRPVEGVRFPDQLFPPRCGSLQGRRPVGQGKNLRRAMGRLVGLQTGSLRRHRGKHRLGRPCRRRLRHRAFRLRRRHPAPESGSRESHRLLGARSISPSARNMPLPG